MNKKDARESLKELSPVLDDLWKGLEDTIQTPHPEEEPKPKKKKEKQEKPVTEETTESSEEVEKEVTPQNSYKPKIELMPNKEERFPGFDFNDFYEKGQTIYLVQVHSKTKTKVLLGEKQQITIRTVYKKSMVGVFKIDRNCILIGADQKDNVFTNIIDAKTFFDSIDAKDEAVLAKELKKKAKEDSEEEIEDEFSNEKEPLPTDDSSSEE